MVNYKRELNDELKMAFMRYQNNLDTPFIMIKDDELILKYHSDKQFHARVNNLTAGVMQIIIPICDNAINSTLSEYVTSLDKDNQ